jgi:predicted phosphodiesterase
MKLHIMSDLHLDHYRDHGAAFLDGLDNPADVCILAGDIADGRFPDQFQKLFIRLSDLYRDIIVVAGNHEYYQSDRHRTHHSIRLASMHPDVIARVHFLDGEWVKVGGRIFHGHTLWYRDDPMNAAYEHWMNDVRLIKNLRSWVYKEQKEFEGYLNRLLKSGEIVVTHHLPSALSIDPKFKNSPLNRFFVCDMEHVIEAHKPALWVHGHTHAPCDYVLGETRVVCNPRGYPRERSFAAPGYKPLEVEI